MLARVRSNLSLSDLCLAGRGVPLHPAEVLEHAFADRLGFPHAILFPYGRTALRALLEGLGHRGQPVLCQAYICAEVPYAVTLSGNRVVFVDSAADHFLPGIDEWRAAAIPSAAMAIITPLFGYPIDRNAERAVRDLAPSAFILYDEAQSYGVTDSGGLQACNADGVLLSLGLGKMATAISGGMLLLRDTALERRIREFRDQNCAPASIARIIKLIAKGVAAWVAHREPALSIVDLLGRHLGLFPVAPEDWLPAAHPKAPVDADIVPSNFQARVGLCQFARIDRFLASRRQIGSYYDRRLREEGFRTFAAPALPNWPRFPLAVADRGATVEALRTEGIQVSLFLPYSCAALPIYRSTVEDCPNAVLWASSMINLPNWHGLKMTGAQRVADSLVRLAHRNPGAVAWPGA